MDSAPIASQTRRAALARRCGQLPLVSARSEARSAYLEGNPMEDEPRGKVDLVAVLYIFGGIPVIVLFLFVLFGLARACNIPA